MFLCCWVVQQKKIKLHKQKGSFFISPQIENLKLYKRHAIKLTYFHIFILFYISQDNSLYTNKKLDVINIFSYKYCFFFCCRVHETIKYTSRYDNSFWLQL